MAKIISNSEIDLKLNIFHVHKNLTLFANITETNFDFYHRDT